MSFQRERKENPRKMRAPKKKRTPARADSLRSLPNIGPTTAAKLRQIGITTKKEFIRRDPYKVFDELRKKVDPTLCRCVLAGIVGAKKGLPWHKVTKQSAKEYEKKHPRHVWGKC
jgi:hypothetical protein